MELEDWLFNELNALDREDLVELIYKFAADCSSLEELADYVDVGIIGIKLMQSGAENVFEFELGMIESPDIKDFVLTCFEKLTPEYFWTVPCSTSGKYHPKVSLGPGGLVRHVKYAIWWGLELMRCWPGLKLSAVDEIIAALLLHDLKKNGERLDAKGFPILKDASAVHGPYLGKQIRKTFSDLVKDERIDRIVCAIEGHMGVWTSPLYENMKPEYQIVDTDLYNVCMLVHLADYCASRKADEAMDEISKGCID
jgi:hypothetical protein